MARSTRISPTTDQRWQILPEAESTTAVVFRDIVADFLSESPRYYSVEVDDGRLFLTATRSEMYQAQTLLEGAEFEEYKRMRANKLRGELLAGQRDKLLFRGCR